LSLGQGVFFGLGSYMMAMFLKLESTSSGSSAQALSSFFGSNLPDFMVWNSVEALPWWWEPFHHVWFTIPAILILPTLLAFALAYAAFRKRVGGVYFSIITLALSAILAIGSSVRRASRAGSTGSTTSAPSGINLDTDQAKLTMYSSPASCCCCAWLRACSSCAAGWARSWWRSGDREDWVRFSATTRAVQGLIFSGGAVLASAGHVHHPGRAASPSLVNIVPPSRWSSMRRWAEGCL
jgi:urea transport system permease protein